MLKVYLDICPLKRPWDDQQQPRISAETALVQAIVRMVERCDLAALRSPVHDEENARNSDPGRAAAIAAWLDSLPLPAAAPVGLPARARSLVKAGLDPADALHLAWAEGLGADMLLTTDDRFVRRAMGLSGPIRVPVLLPATGMSVLIDRLKP
ncbi:MAG: hypothetical protein KIS87_09565 [Phycisphaeraceae bacterium]|nr:hypothetical protein [Phycisphaeraceae bacterium]